MVYSHSISADTVCGSVIRLGEQGDGRFATFGGILKLEMWDERFMLYAMTAGHVAKSVQLEEQEIDTSYTLVDSCLDRDIDDEEYFLDKDEFWPDEDPCRAAPQTCQDLNSEEETIPGLLTPSTEDCSWWRIGRISTTSRNEESSGSDVDWSLISLHDPFLYRPNVLLYSNAAAPISLTDTLSKKEQGAMLGASDRSVVVIGGMSGSKRGTISSTWSYLMLAPAKSFSKHLTLTFLDGSSKSYHFHNRFQH